MALLAAYVLAAAISQPVIKKIGVVGPITGSQDTAGQVEVESEFPLQGLVVTLQSSDPRVASVPPTISVRGVTTFAVKTYPVKSATDVIITASSGSSTKSATLRVLPPKLAVVGCDQPAETSSFTPLTCTAWLDGSAPEDLSASISASAAEIHAPSSLTIPKGAHKQAFSLMGKAIAQSLTGQISVTYAGITKSHPVTIRPTALREIAFPSIMGSHSARGGMDIALEVELLAPAPPSGLNVRLSVEGPPGTPVAIVFDSSVIQVPAGSKHGDAGFSTRYVSQSTAFTITASADFLGEKEKLSTSFTVTMNHFMDLVADGPHFSNVPPGGEKGRITIRMDGPAGPSTWFDVTYSGDLHVSGPARVQVPYGSTTHDFEVTVLPCSGQQRCANRITVAGSFVTIWADPNP